MYIQICDRCGRKTNNTPAFLLPVTKEKGSYQVNRAWLEPVVLCNNCLHEFNDFLRFVHERFNTSYIEEDNFEEKEKCQI